MVPGRCAGGVEPLDEEAEGGAGRGADPGHRPSGGGRTAGLTCDRFRRLLPAPTWRIGSLRIAANGFITAAAGCFRRPPFGSPMNLKRLAGIAGSDGRNRGVLLGFVCLIFALIMIFLVFAPRNIPGTWGQIVFWLRHHWTIFIWIIVAIVIMDSFLTFEEFRAPANRDLNELDRQVSHLKARLDELNRKT